MVVYDFGVDGEYQLNVPIEPAEVCENPRYKLDLSGFKYPWELEKDRPTPTDTFSPQLLLLTKNPRHIRCPRGIRASIKRVLKLTKANIKKMM